MTYSMLNYEGLGLSMRFSCDGPKEQCQIMCKYSFHYRFFFKIFYCPTRKEKKLYTYDKNGIPIIQIVEKRTTTIHQTNMGTRDDDKSSKN